MITIVKLFFLFCFVVPFALAQTDMVSSKQKTWAATTGENWYVYNRACLIGSVADSIQKGAFQGDVRNKLGEPQSVLNFDQNTIWTYGLSRWSFLNVVFDSEGRVIQKVQTQYRRFSDQELATATNIESVASDPSFDIGAVKALMGKGGPDHDRVQIVAGASRILNEKFSDKRVEAVFGKPDYVLDRGRLVWTYRIRASSFLQIGFLDNRELLGAYIRHYDRNNGRLNLISLWGLMDRAQEGDLDVACWRTTVPGFVIDIFRTGIGVRMSQLVKPGMTKDEVIGMLGNPTEISTATNQTKRFHYVTSPESRITINFESSGKVIGAVNQHFFHH